jgi:putative ABC transport system permease protein
MGSVLQDLRHACRMLLRSPLLTGAAVLTLALGIAGTTVIFGAVNAMLLRPLPFPDGERIVVVSETVRRESVERRPASYPDFEDWRTRNRVFEEMAILDSPELTLGPGGEPERVSAEAVSASYFSILGTRAALGRTFLAEEDRLPGTRVAVLSHGLWQRRFGADPAVLGRSVRLDQHDYTVVGVLPEGSGRLYSDDAELWVPFSAVFDEDYKQRGYRSFTVLAKLKPGVGIEAAQSEMDTIARDLETAFSDSNKDRGVQLVPLREELFGDLRRPLLVLFGAVGFVLLIACANVANLQLARAAARSREVAIRAALGAGRWRLVRQFLTEGVVLGLAGGAIGVLLATWATDALRRLSPIDLPPFVRLGVDLTALGFALAASVATGLLFGLAPALGGARPDLHDALKEGSRGSSGGSGRQRARSVLVVAEVGLALMLLIGAGLLIQTFLKLQRFDPGFRPEGVVTVSLNLPDPPYGDAQILAFDQRLLERTAALPSVTGVALASDVPLEGDSSARMVALETKGGTPADELVRVYTHRVSPGFFAAIGTPLVQGRDFTAQDRDPGPGSGVIIVSQAMARKYWPDGDAIGRRIKGKGGDDWFTIVGVAGDVKYRQLIHEVNADPDVYYDLFQIPGHTARLVVRSSGAAEPLVGALRGLVHERDANVPLYRVHTLAELLTARNAPMRFNALLVGIFSGVALVLSIIGIYGVVAYSVHLRMHEIGIRIAIGAGPLDVIRMVLGQGLRMTVLGVALGLGGALWMTRILESLLYGVTSTDPATFLGVPLLLLGVACAASYLPARKATRIDPTLALRSE